MRQADRPTRVPRCRSVVDGAKMMVEPFDAQQPDVFAKEAEVAKVRQNDRCIVIAILPMREHGPRLDRKHAALGAEQVGAWKIEPAHPLGERITEKFDVIVEAARAMYVQAECPDDISADFPRRRALGGPR